MKNTNMNLRKAAVLLRSVDAETAAALLAQLSTEEAALLREAVRDLGSIDADEQADVVAELRREKPLASATGSDGVELALSSNGGEPRESIGFTTKLSGRRFEFLEQASAATVAAYLCREHAQTVAVVLSHLAPQRASEVLAELPQRIQAEAMERLANLGDTDAEIVGVLEKELAEWLSNRNADQRNSERRDAVSAIMAAADGKTRDAIIGNLKSRNASLAARFGPKAPREPQTFSGKRQIDEYRVVRSMAKRHQVNEQLRSLIATPENRSDDPSVSKASSPTPRHGESPMATCRLPKEDGLSTVAHRQRSQTSAPARPQVDFEQLAHFDSRMMAQLLAVADPNLLALALAGSSDELVDSICNHMPKRIAKAFRRELRRMGPTRLSDVEAAQRAIADLASQQMERPPAIRQLAAAR